MPTYKSDFLNTLQERGFIEQHSDIEALDEKLQSGVQSAYIGYDATAPSLHVGNLLTIMMLYWWQQSGHKPITLMGGATSKIGDPSGKDETRKLNTQENIDKNISTIRTVFSKYLKYGDGETDAIMVNNDDWMRDVNYIEFLRDYGRHFSINRMLGFESVKMRLEREQTLSFLEFNYMIFQGFDFLHLNREYGTILQMGGNDQWGNLLNGVELTRRVEQNQVHALTVGLLTTSSGAKMGKSANGAIWLNADMLSPYDYYQFWRNTEDGDVVRFMKLYTVMPMDEIAKYENLQGAEINEAKKKLAFESTKLCHGEESAREAEETAKKTFEQGSVGDDLPTIEIDGTRLDAGVSVIELFKETGLVASNGEARRLIKGGGARINDEKVASDELKCSLADLANGVIKLSAGKKKHALVKVA